MKITRKELLLAEATMNQMRNAIAHLARFMVNNYVDDMNSRLQRMGRNIGRTYVNYWKPTDKVDINNVKDVIATIYKNVLNSSISIELITQENLIKVQDKKCSLCKYQYSDIDVAGCEILIGMVAEMINKINASNKKSPSLYLEPVEVSESKGYGHDQCVQLYKYKIGGL